MVSGLLMVARFMVLRSFFVMLRGVLVMLGSLVVMVVSVVSHCTILFLTKLVSLSEAAIDLFCDGLAISVMRFWPMPFGHAASNACRISPLTLFAFFTITANEIRTATLWARTLLRHRH